MSRKSIGQLHAQVTANASQFVNEFKRADNEQRRASASIRAGVSKTMRDIQREFSIPKLSKGLMTGLGIGSGMQIVETGISRIGEMIRDAAEDAKSFVEFMDEAIVKGRELRHFHLRNFIEVASPGKAADAIEKEIEKLENRIRGAYANRASILQDLATVGAPGFQAGSKEGMALRAKYNVGGLFANERDIGDAISARENSAFDAIRQLEKELADWKKSLQGIKDKTMPQEIGKALDNFFTPIEKAFEERTELVKSKLKEFFQPLDERTESVRAFMKEDPADSKTFRRWERAAGDIAVDEMTKRGLGTGARYDNVGRQTNAILSDILAEIRRARTAQTGVVYN